MGATGKLLLSLFVLTFTIFLIAYQAYELTKYEVIKETTMKILRQRYNLSEMDMMINLTCNMTDTLVLPLDDEQLSFACNEVRNAEDLMDKIFEHFYYKNYDCGLLDCYKSSNKLDLFYYVSKSANGLYYKSFVLALLASFVFAVSYVISREDRKAGIGRIGLSLIWIAVPLLIIGFAVKFSVPVDIVGLQSNLMKVALVTLIVGVVAYFAPKLKF